MATNLETLPGFCDIHLHFREPGGDPDDPEEETIESGSMAGASNGVTHGGVMPNLIKADGTKIPLDNVAAIDDQSDRINKTSWMDLGIHGLAWTPSLGNLKQMKGKVLAVKAFGDVSTGGFNMPTPAERREATAMMPPGMIMMLHAEGGTLKEMIGYAEEFDTTIHVLHISTREELEMAYEAKLRRPNKVTIGANYAYLHLTRDHRSLFEHPGFAKVKPPLGTLEDQQALWMGIQNGAIDILESDMAPHKRSKKENPDWDQVPFGLSTLDSVFPMLWTDVVEGRLTRKKLIDLYSTNPRKIFKIPSSPSSYFHFDPDVTYKIGAPYFSRSGWSPFEGWPVRGKVTQTFLAGRCIYDQGQFRGKPDGQVILPKAA